MKRWGWGDEGVPFTHEDKPAWRADRRLEPTELSVTTQNCDTSAPEPPVEGTMTIGGIGLVARSNPSPASLTSIGRTPPTRRTAPPTSASVPIPKITSGIRNLLTRPRDCGSARCSARAPGLAMNRRAGAELQRALLRLASWAVAGGSHRSSHRAQIRADGEGNGWRRS
jgi:hypothetical protein